MTVFRVTTSLLTITTMLGACATNQRVPEIPLLDGQAFAPAKREAEPQEAVRFVEVPKPLPLPGQLKPVPKLEEKTTERRPPQDRVIDANEVARLEPVKDGYINSIQVYPFTKGALYQLYAAVNQVTDIALEMGEQLVSVSAGDTVRWVVGDTTSGTGDTAQVHILVKPVGAGLETNLVITTDRRTYHLELRSSEKTYMASVSWTYPASALVSLRKEQAQADALATTVADTGINVDQLRFRYRLEGDAPWKPRQVFDDGAKVYIQFPSGLAQSGGAAAVCHRFRWQTGVGQLSGARDDLHCRSVVCSRRASAWDGAATCGANRAHGCRLAGDPIMTRATLYGNDRPDDKDAPESLKLRSRPEPVTRINRNVLIATAATLLVIVCGLIMIALQPPTLRSEAQRELVNVENKPITDGLSRLPATYAGLPAPKPVQTLSLPPGVPQLVADDALTTTEERVAQDRLLRMAGQARESPVFFRLTLKEALPEKAAANSAPSRSLDRNLEGDLTKTVAFQAPVAMDGLAGDGDLAAASRSDQGHKLAVLNGRPDKDIYNPHALQRPISPYQLMAGTIIAASLVSGLNSDLPGFVIAHVTENVFDSIEGRHLLVPQGSRLIGKYDSVVAFGQERALVVWQRIIRPDGTSVVIDNLPATDTGGYAGLADEVDLHTWKLLKGVALATVLGVGSELAFNATDSDLVRALQLSTQSTTNRAGQRLVERQINVQPTITVRPGWPLRIIVHKDIVLRPYEQPTSR